VTHIQRVTAARTESMGVDLDGPPPPPPAPRPPAGNDRSLDAADSQPTVDLSSAGGPHEHRLSEDARRHLAALVPGIRRTLPGDTP
jgi:hypothetical protein